MMDTRVPPLSMKTLWKFIQRPRKYNIYLDKYIHYIYLLVLLIYTLTYTHNAYTRG